MNTPRIWWGTAAVTLLMGVIYHVSDMEPEYSLEQSQTLFSAIPKPKAVNSPIASPSSQPTPQVVFQGERPQASQDTLNDVLRESKLSEAWLIAHGLASGRALQNLHALLDGHTELNTTPRYAMSITPTGAAKNISTNTSVLVPEEHYVHASLPTGFLGSEDSVLVRWRKFDDDTVIELSSQEKPGNPDEALQLWMHRTQDWSPGRYQIEVIAPNASLTLLAAAEFEIAPSGMPVTSFEYPLITSTQESVGTDHQPQ